MKKPVVSIVIGSDSDLEVMKEAIKILEKFEISYEFLILSAHRTPQETEKYAKTAKKKGIKVIIAAAGGAAHLAGVISSYFPLPVIGIPIKSSPLNGIDSLYSTVQMPAGVPVATVGINGAKNAALLAVKILAIEDKKLQKKIEDYKNEMAQLIIKKSNRLKKLGIKKYLESRKKNDSDKNNS